MLIGWNDWIAESSWSNRKGCNTSRRRESKTSRNISPKRSRTRSNSMCLINREISCTNGIGWSTWEMQSAVWERNQARKRRYRERKKGKDSTWRGNINLTNQKWKFIKNYLAIRRVDYNIRTRQREVICVDSQSCCCLAVATSSYIKSWRLAAVVGNTFRKQHNS